MSIAKVTSVKNARKDQGECEKCGKEIHIGDPYRHFTVGFRSTVKQVRCIEPTCFPRPSERESSKLSSVMAAQESAIDAISNIDIDHLRPDVTDQDFVDAIKEYVLSVAEVAREVAEEYREASTNDSGTVYNTGSEGRADDLECGADELESWEPSESEPVEPSDGEIQSRQEWLDGIKDEAIEAIDQMTGA